jgi:hypothetical protein
MDGSLYAGIGDWMDPQLANPQTSGAQVLRLDSPTGDWVEDQNFLQAAVDRGGSKAYQAIAALGKAHFDHDSNKNPITPVDVLIAGFWNLSVAGLEVGQKTVVTGSSGAHGTWTIDTLVAWPKSSGQVRSFGSYTDSVTHQEMVFAGSDLYGVFSGAFNSSENAIQWSTTAEPGTSRVEGHRIMSFAACGGKLYASDYDAIVVRTDGTNPSWQKFYQYSGPPLNAQSSGFRGLTCVPKLDGSGSMLIASLEGPGDIYEFPLDGSQPTIELYTSNYLATELGYWVGYVIAAYNDMIVYPQSGSTGCPDLLIGLGVINAANYVNDYEGLYPTPTFLVRHCNGIYGFRTVIDPSITPAPPLLSTRALAPSQFPGDPAGTLYAGGYDAHHTAAHNTDWVYRGTPK